MKKTGKIAGRELASEQLLCQACSTFDEALLGTGVSKLNPKI
jgi:hypothetical protein